MCIHTTKAKKVTCNHPYYSQKRKVDFVFFFAKGNGKFVKRNIAAVKSFFENVALIPLYGV